MNKFKSAKERTNAEAEKEHSMQWQAPLRRRLNKDGFVDNITLRIRLRFGDSEQDFQAKFNPEEFTAGKVVEYIGRNFQLTSMEMKMFRIWILSQDLGMKFYHNL